MSTDGFLLQITSARGAGQRSGDAFRSNVTRTAKLRVWREPDMDAERTTEPAIGAAVAINGYILARPRLLLLSSNRTRLLCPM
jgi:hypothetical protein